MRAFNFGGKSKRRKSEIGLIPIINVIFLLIIFFMVEGSIKKFDVIPINAPVSSSGSAIFGEHVEVMVSETEIILNLELVDENSLRDGLVKILEQDPETEITVKSDASLAADRFIDILDIIKETGAKNLYLVTVSSF